MTVKCRVEARGGLPPSTAFHLVFLRQGLFLDPELTKSLSWLTSKLQDLLVCLPSVGITHMPFCILLQRIWMEVLMLAQHALLQLSHLPATFYNKYLTRKCFIFYNFYQHFQAHFFSTFSFVVGPANYVGSPSRKTRQLVGTALQLECKAGANNFAELSDLKVLSHWRPGNRMKYCLFNQDFLGKAKQWNLQF